MHRIGALLCVGVVLLGLSACGDDDGPDAAAATTTAAPQDVSMIGTWTGHRERMASSEGYRNGTATLVVEAQEGLTFTGTMTWSTPDGDQTEPLVGAFTPGGTLMAGADEEGMYSFELVDATTLDYCYMQSVDGFRTTCARLVKE